MTESDTLAGLEQWIRAARTRTDRRGGREGREAAVLEVLYRLRALVDRTIDERTVRGRLEGAPWGTLASSKQAAQLRYKRAVARGINPHGVKDGPYGYELTADGTPLVELPDRYQVIVGGDDVPGNYLWSCVELPEVNGSITDLEQLHSTASEAVARHLGREDVAVYIDVSNIDFDFTLPRGLGK
jgi:hypothetical protein